MTVSAGVLYYTSTGGIGSLCGWWGGCVEDRIICSRIGVWNGGL